MQKAGSKVSLNTHDEETSNNENKKIYYCKDNECGRWFDTNEELIVNIFNPGSRFISQNTIP
jgi:hypothetical protein